MADNYVIEMLHITKEFPGIKANDDITLQLRKGEIHALLGENGAGKSTLMSVLFGLYQPEQGTIRKNGQEVNMNLFDFTYCGNYNRQIQNLARIAPEKWSFGDSGDNGILKGYLENTFRRLYEEGKVTEEKEYALFHTGLFNQYYQPIYAYFVPNVVPDRQKWFLEGFYTDYSLLKIKIKDLPPRASYVENPSDLVFDTKLPVVPQYEHIFDVEQNVQRLPAAVRERGMR